LVRNFGNEVVLLSRVLLQVPKGLEDLVDLGAQEAKAPEVQVVRGVPEVWEVLLAVLVVKVPWDLHLATELVRQKALVLGSRLDEHSLSKRRISRVILIWVMNIVFMSHVAILLCHQ
jgi:hypothetical protein